MDGVVVPIVPSSYHQNGMVTTPDNGLMYCSSFDVSYIPPVEFDCLPKIRVMSAAACIESFACAPDWTEKRLFATLDTHRNVYVWDLDLLQPVQGHRGHAAGAKKSTYSKKQTKEVVTSVCFSANRKLLSCDRSTLVVYCLLSDTYTVHPNLFHRQSIVVVLVPSPVDRDVFIAGMKNGVIQLFSLKTMSVLTTLRRHDKEIVSIACMHVPVRNAAAPRPAGKSPGAKGSAAQLSASASKADQQARPKKQARKKPDPEADASDFFDIYEFNEGQEEFGTIIDRETQNERKEFREKIKTVEGFNFLEACENLKDDILKAATQRDEEEDEEEDVDDEEAGERSRINREGFNTDDENELDECEKLRDYVVVDNDGENSEEDDGEDRPDEPEASDCETRLVLVTACRDTDVWFWDYETGLPIDKIVVPSATTPHNFVPAAKFTTAVWLDERHVVVNCPSAGVTEWTVSFASKNGMVHLEAEMGSARYPVKKCYSIVRGANPISTSITGGDARYLWCGAWRKLVCVKVSPLSGPVVVLDYTCVFPVSRSLLENPLESMVVAVGGDLINLATLRYDCITATQLMNKTGAHVMIVDWHPEDEEKLAFGTNDGRIGVIDTTAASIHKAPVLLRSFDNSEIYALKWCYLTNEANQRRLVLFASGKRHLAYYHMTGAEKYEPIMCTQFGEVSNVAAANNLCFVGTQNGTVYVTDLDHNLRQLYRRKVSGRYISSLEYKRNWLAVGSNDVKITLVNFTNGIADEDGNNLTHLEGHEDGICKLRWSRGETMLLVSCSFDRTIRVWDALAGTCLSVLQTGCFVFSAMFSPLDESTILYVGKNCALSALDYTKPQRNVPKVWAADRKKAPVKFASLKGGDSAAKTSTKGGAGGQQAAVLPPSAAAAGTERAPRHGIDELTDAVKRATLKESTVPAQPRSNVPPTTTFPLTYREVNRSADVLECIVKLLHSVEPEPEPEPEKTPEADLSDDAEEDLRELAELNGHEKVKEETQTEQAKVIPRAVEAEDDKMFYNEKLFSTEAKLKQLIQEEANHIQVPVTASIGLVMLPQLLHKLKDVILENVSKKSLTPQLLALAPYVSHIFWRQCCQAYAYQLIESRQPLAAVPYFLASHKVDESIEALCDAKYYREAWAVCRLQKMPDDPVLARVAADWAKHVESHGNLEAAALVWTGVKEYSKAIDVLMKRREVTADIQRAIDELNVKLKQESAASGEPQRK